MGLFFWLSQAEVLVALLLTFGNFLSFFFHKNLLILFFRQIVLISLCVFLYVFKKEKFFFIEQNNQIRIALQRKYPFTKLERPLSLIAFFSFFVFLSTWVYPLPQFFWFLSSFFCLVYVVFSFFVVLLTLTTPELSDYYNLKKVIKKHGFRSIYTASTIVQLCTLCGKAAFVGGLGIYFGPKIIAGDPAYRGDIFNMLSYPYTGIKAKYDHQASQAVYLLHMAPETKPLFVKEDGWIDVLKMQEIVKEKNLTVPRSLDVNHQHQISWWKKKD